ncbi:MAG: preprotein translocase subunit SecE [Candidatus Omnitrophica bacterium]|nr:preprotein translocase subunit SecE [Candidatus Omnitrophota bacterium]
MEKVKTFFTNVKLEMAKVSWPPRAELFESTSVVIVSLAILTVIVGVIDLILTYLIGFMFK